MTYVCETIFDKNKVYLKKIYQKLNMLELDKKLWERDKILKIFSKGDWTSSDTDIILYCTLNLVKELIETCIENNERCVLLFDGTKGELPTLYYITKIVSYLVGINQLISAGVNYSVVFASKEKIGFFLPNILKVYSPARPLLIANTKEELKQIIKENKNKVETACVSCN